MSPEQIQSKPYDEKSDIWSVGCIIYELSGLKPPFEASSQLQLEKEIKKGIIKRIPEYYSEDLWTIIKSMLQLNPLHRPEVKDILENPMLKSKFKELELRDYEKRLR